MYQFRHVFFIISIIAYYGKAQEAVLTINTVEKFHHIYALIDYSKKTLAEYSFSPISGVSLIQSW